MLQRPLTALREFGTFCTRHPKWAVAMLLFVATWTVELYWLQAETLVFPNITGPRYAMWAPKLRFALDMLFILTLTLSLRRRWLMGAVVGSFVVYLILLTYFKYFLKPLSLLTIVTNWREGLEFSGFALDMFPQVAALLLLAALVAKVSLLLISHRASLPRPCARTMGLMALCGYVGLYAAVNYLDPMHYIRTTRGVGRVGYIRGYAGPWFAEWYYLRADDLLAEVNDRRRYDRLSPGEANIPIRRKLVILQVESLDTNIFGYKVDGQEVTPFLNRLRDQSMYYRVRAMHWHGSADADFAALTGVMGSTRINMYNVDSYRYSNTTPQLLARCGYDVYSFHGNRGDFYRRRDAYQRMGLDGIYFREELASEFELPSGEWGISDEDVFRLSARLMDESTDPTCHFIITLTTHTPYTHLPPGNNEIYASPSTTAELYINNMRYLDNCLREYVTALGSDTTIFLYADHPTQEFEGYTSDRDTRHGLEYVPCLIYDSNEDLSALQTTRNSTEATDGSLYLVDVVNYLRGQIERNCRQQPRPAVVED